MKQAYEKVVDFYSETYNYYLREVEVLPECKKEMAFGSTAEYQKVSRRILFGFVNKVYWVPRDCIVWYDKPSTEYFNCNCGGGNN